MSNLADLKIYLTHEKIVLTNDRGFRVEFDIPSPGKNTPYSPPTVTEAPDWAVSWLRD